MPAPSPLVIATGAVLRLVKEENSYHKELADQEKNVKTLEDKIASGQGSEDGNDEYMLKQQVSYPSPLQIETPATRRVCFSGLGANCSANSFLY